MEKLRAAGYDNSFYTLEEGVEEYVVEFLRNGTVLLARQGNR